MLFEGAPPTEGAVPMARLRALEQQDGGAFLTALTGARPRLARAVGELWTDRSLEPGTGFVYRFPFDVSSIPHLAASPPTWQFRMACDG